MRENWPFVLAIFLIVLCVAGVLATGFIYGWGTEIEMCWNYYSNQWEPCY